MDKSKKTVLFGPFIGEFGWELLYWQGWVRRACRTIFKDYHKIVASFPGRSAFYPDSDEFWGHPQEIIGKKAISSRAYATDNWFAGLTERGQNRDTSKDAKERWEGSLLVKTLTEHYKQQLPADAQIISPISWIDLPNLPPAFGTKIEKYSDNTYKLTTTHIRFSQQILEIIRPTAKGKEILNKLVAPDKKLIAIFPRARMTRRSEKNWPKENYIAIIEWIVQNFPDKSVAIIGEPGGAYFATGDMPAGCINLINIDPQHRMDIQVAALNQSVIALGSISGATLFALACGCPTIQWGPKELQRRNAFENYLNTSIYYYPYINPSLSDMCTIIEQFLKWQQNHPNDTRFTDWNLHNPFLKAKLVFKIYQCQLIINRDVDQVEYFK